MLLDQAPNSSYVILGQEPLPPAKIKSSRIDSKRRFDPRPYEGSQNQVNAIVGPLSGLKRGVS